MFKVKTSFPDAMISINVKAPDEAGKIRCSDRQLMTLLSNTFGLHTILGSSGSPEALVAALHNKEIEYEILEGAEILDLPRVPLPDGAIP